MMPHVLTDGTPSASHEQRLSRMMPHVLTDASQMQAEPTSALDGEKAPRCGYSGMEPSAVEAESNWLILKLFVFFFSF